MFNRPLVPGFLKKIDDYLLINKPTVWSTRAHLVVWYALLFAAALTVLCFVVPFDARLESNVQSWILLVVIIIILAFITWLIFLLRFNVFKKFGQLPPGYTLMTFFLYALVIGCFIGWAYIPGAVESVRANKGYTNEEIIRDVNTINLDLCRLERDSLKLQWTPDTAVLRRYMPAKDSAGVEEVGVHPDDETVVDSAVSFRPEGNRIVYFTYKDSADLFAKVRRADSLVRPNDSTYIFYECPDYVFINDYITDEYSKLKRLHSVDIYNKVLKHYQAPDRKAVKKEYDSLLVKYNTDNFLVDYTYPKHYRFNRSEYMNHTQEKYNTSAFSGSMMNISNKKYRWQHDLLSFVLRPFYYMVLALTLLVFIFRHSTIKTFFISILTGILLVILTSLAFVLLDLRSGDTVLWAMIFYFLVFAIAAFTIGMDSVRRAWKGISLNLFVFFLPYLPLICVTKYYEYLRRHYSSYLFPEKFTHQELHMLLAEIGGFVLLVVLLEPVIRPLYRKWYAQPEQ